MSNKNLIILAGITGLMIVWAVVQSKISNRPGIEAEKPSYLIQGLDPETIDSIVIGKVENPLTLNRDKNGFVVVNKDNYPADTKEINSLITSCLDIKTVEFFTNEPSNHKDLGVTEDDAETIVKFMKQDSSLIAGIIIGNSKGQERGNFVRMIPGDKVYITLEAPQIEKQALNYLNKEIVTINRDDIESVTVSLPNGTYTLKTENEGKNIVLENLPEGKTVKDDELENVFTALPGIEFDDVKTESTADTDLVFDKKYVCGLKDSTIYTIKIAQKYEKSFAVFEAEFTDVEPVVKEKGVESEEELKKKEAKLLANDKANEFTARHKGWVYEISKHDAQNMSKPLAELFKDKKLN